MSMQHIGQAVVRGGQVIVSGLTLPDGERVQVVVTQLHEQPCRTIDEVRQILQGAVIRYDDPFETAIPVDSW